MNSEQCSVNSEQRTVPHSGPLLLLSTGRVSCAMDMKKDLDGVKVLDKRRSVFSPDVSLLISSLKNVPLPFPPLLLPLRLSRSWVI